MDHTNESASRIRRRDEAQPDNGWPAEQKRRRLSDAHPSANAHTGSRDPDGSLYEDIEDHHTRQRYAQTPPRPLASPGSADVRTESADRWGSFDGGRDSGYGAHDSTLPTGPSTGRPRGRGRRSDRRGAAGSGAPLPDRFHNAPMSANNELALVRYVAQDQVLRRWTTGGPESGLTSRLQLFKDSIPEVAAPPTLVKKLKRWRDSHARLLRQVTPAAQSAPVSTWSNPSDLRVLVLMESNHNGPWLRLWHELVHLGLQDGSASDQAQPSSSARPEHKPEPSPTLASAKESPVMRSTSSLPQLPPTEPMAQRVNASTRGPTLSPSASLSFPRPEPASPVQPVQSPSVHPARSPSVQPTPSSPQLSALQAQLEEQSRQIALLQAQSERQSQMLAQQAERQSVQADRYAQQVELQSLQAERQAQKVDKQSDALERVEKQLESLHALLRQG